MVVGKVVAHLISNTNYMEKKIRNDKIKRDMVSREGGGIFMSNIDYQRIEI